MADEFDAKDVAYTALQACLRRTDGTRCDVHFEGAHEVLTEVIAGAYLEGKEAAYDECNVIRGEDAKRLLDSLEKVASPAEIERRQEWARNYIAQVTRPREKP